jgi:TolB protein
MKIPCLLLFTFVNVITLAQPAATGTFSGHADVGHPAKAGSIQYDPLTQDYTIKGAGYNIWFNRDEFQYAYQPIKGNFILTANFSFAGKGANPHRKVGWMLRESLKAEAVHISATLHGDGLTVLQWRPQQGVAMRDPQDELFYPKKKVQIMQLERAGDTVIMRVANTGEPLQIVGKQLMPNLPDSLLAGLFICSHDSNVVEEARVWNVRIDRTVPDAFNAYRQGFLGSRMEVMEVSTGQRKVIHQSAGRFEAPNFMPGGKELLYNEGGFAWTIPAEGGKPEKLATGTLDQLNNDHGISFDGKWLALSHHRRGLPGGGSSVYVWPLQGGEPKLLTEKTPSYWHGWSPDNKQVLYVAQRDSGMYNIYTMNVSGGKEVQLTFNKDSHVDGPEYAPDGKYIYYNGNSTGTMQLWRMKPDGTVKEQLTFDEYHNWFPHISPDGKWIAFISFPPTIDPGDHPFYKRVMLRLMPVNGTGAPKVIAYLYGGQGTINVPSWSPDSRYIAFVSNW